MLARIAAAGRGRDLGQADRAEMTRHRGLIRASWMVIVSRAALDIRHASNDQFASGLEPSVREPTGRTTWPSTGDGVASSSDMGRSDAVQRLGHCPVSQVDGACAGHSQRSRGRGSRPPAGPDTGPARSLATRPSGCLRHCQPGCRWFHDNAVRTTESVPGASRRGAFLSRVGGAGSERGSGRRRRAASLDAVRGPGWQCRSGLRLGCVGRYRRGGARRCSSRRMFRRTRGRRPTTRSGRGTPGSTSRSSTALRCRG